jgi:hypothetical protein
MYYEGKKEMLSYSQEVFSVCPGIALHTERRCIPQGTSYHTRSTTPLSLSSASPSDADRLLMPILPVAEVKVIPPATLPTLPFTLTRDVTTPLDLLLGQAFLFPILGWRFALCAGIWLGWSWHVLDMRSGCSDRRIDVVNDAPKELEPIVVPVLVLDYPPFQNHPEQNAQNLSLLLARKLHQRAQVLVVLQLVLKVAVVIVEPRDSHCLELFVFLSPQSHYKSFQMLVLHLTRFHLPIFVLGHV